MKQLIKNITIQIYKVLTYLIPVNKKDDYISEQQWT